MALYHFAYQTGLTSPDGRTGIGFGNWAMELDHPIRGPEDLNRVVEAIRVRNPGNTTVVILSWQRFEES